MTKFLIVAALAALPVAALAQPPRGPAEPGYDPYASAAIERADLSVAEQRLQRRLSANQGDVSAMLNLAYVLGSTGRASGAARYYEQVLGTDNELLESLDGAPVWSHDLARRGMASEPTLASR